MVKTQNIYMNARTLISLKIDFYLNRKQNILVLQPETFSKDRVISNISFLNTEIKEG